MAETDNEIGAHLPMEHPTMVKLAHMVVTKLMQRLGLREVTFSVAELQGEMYINWHFEAGDDAMRDGSITITADEQRSVQ